LTARAKPRRFALAAACSSARRFHISQCRRRVAASSAACARSPEGPGAVGDGATAELELELEGAGPGAAVAVGDGLSKKTWRMGGRMCGRRYGGMSAGSTVTS
jgi:hypothetical protein